MFIMWFVCILSAWGVAQCLAGKLLWCVSNLANITHCCMQRHHSGR